MTFLQKSYGEYSTVEKPVMVLMSYEGSDDDKVEKVPEINQNNNHYYNVFSDSKSNNKAKEHFLMKMSTMMLKQPPRLLTMQKWYML